MTINTTIVIRHALRQDSVDPDWILSSPTPYNPPLASKGFDQIKKTATVLSSLLSNAISNSQSFPTISCSSNVVIHCSPFLRCVQSALGIAKSLVAQNNVANTPQFSVTIRIDAFLGEWLTPDYFASISSPPADNHESLRTSALTWLLLNSPKNVSIDYVWDSTKMGPSGDYGESWSSMHGRITSGLTHLLDHYNTNKYQNSASQQQPTTLILVSHGAACNPLVGSLLHLPILSVIGLASYCMLSTCPKSLFHPTQISPFSTSSFSDSSFSKPYHHHHHHQSATDLCGNGALDSEQFGGKYGHTLDTEKEYDPKSTDLSAQLNKLNTAKPKVISINDLTNSNTTSNDSTNSNTNNNSSTSLNIKSTFSNTQVQVCLDHSLDHWKAVAASLDLSHLVTDTLPTRSNSAVPLERQLSFLSVSSSSSLTQTESSTTNLDSSKLKNVYFKSSLNESSVSINSQLGSKFPKYSLDNTFSCVPLGQNSTSSIASQQFSKSFAHANSSFSGFSAPQSSSSLLVPKFRSVVSMAPRKEGSRVYTRKCKSVSEESANPKSDAKSQVLFSIGSAESEQGEDYEDGDFEVDGQDVIQGFKDLDNIKESNEKPWSKSTLEPPSFHSTLHSRSTPSFRYTPSYKSKIILSSRQNSCSSQPGFEYDADSLPPLSFSASNSYTSIQELSETKDCTHVSKHKYGTNDIPSKTSNTDQITLLSFGQTPSQPTFRISECPPKHTSPGPSKHPDSSSLFMIGGNQM